MSCNINISNKYIEARVDRFNKWLEDINKRLAANDDWSLEDQGNYLELTLRMKCVLRLTVEETQKQLSNKQEEVL